MNRPIKICLGGVVPEPHKLGLQVEPLKVCAVDINILRFPKIHDQVYDVYKIHKTSMEVNQIVTREACFTNTTPN